MYLPNSLQRTVSRSRSSTFVLSPRKDQCPICNHHKQLVLDGAVSEGDELNGKSMKEKVILLEVEVAHISANIGEDDDAVEKILHLAEDYVEKFEVEYKKHKVREYKSLSIKDDDKRWASIDPSF